MRESRKLKRHNRWKMDAASRRAHVLAVERIARELREKGSRG
jgi:HD superfamily phosphodiesterase